MRLEKSTVFFDKSNPTSKMANTDESILIDKTIQCSMIYAYISFVVDKQ